MRAMLESPLPRFVDLRKLVGKRTHLVGQVLLADLPRLDELLAQSDGVAQVGLAGTIDEDNRRVVSGTVQASLPVQCQRCLDTFEIRVDEKFDLALLWSDSEAAGLPKHLDALVVDDEPTELWELLTDELLLAIPQAPRHAENDCVAHPLAKQDIGIDAEEHPNPFSVLAALKRKE